MELWSILRQKLRALTRRKRLEQDLNDEMAFHLAMRQQKLRAQGVAESEAHAASKRAFGNAALLKEKTRDLWTFHWLEHLRQDLHYAMRSLRKTPVLTTVVVLSLALGIGANTAIFSMINSVILRMLPIQKPQEFVLVLTQRPGREPDGGYSNALWEAIRDQQDVFSGTLAWSSVQFNLAQGGAAKLVNGIFVSGNYFNTLGIAPAAGRLISAADDDRGCTPTAVLSYGFWQSHFGAAENALGSTISLNQQSFQVIGVSPEHFYGVEVGKNFDVAVPVCASVLLDKDNINSPSRGWLTAMGRVKAGIPLEQLQARIAILSPSIIKAGVDSDWDPPDQQRFLLTKLVVSPASSGYSDLRQTFQEPLTILMVIVALVLLIACANIASLLLARATTRTREIAIRKALGASRKRLIQQLLTESLLLSVMGGGVGLLLARWGSILLVRNLSTGRNPVFLDLSLDGPVLGFTFAAAVLTGMLVGLLPALRSTRVALIEAMKARTTAGSENRSHFRAGKWIVGGQVALSLLLLVGGGLLLRTFTKLLTLDVGFDRNNVLVAIAKPPWFARDTDKIPVEQRSTAYEEIRRRIQAIPGVISAACSYTTPMGDNNWFNMIQVETPGASQGEVDSVLVNLVSPGYFATMRTPLLAGRDFDEHDTKTSSSVAIVTQALAHQFFPGINAVGRRFGWYKDKTRPQVEIIGIVKDSKYERMREKMRSTVFLPTTQTPPNEGYAQEFVLRTSVPPRLLISSVQKAVNEVNQGIPLEFHTLAEQVNDNLVQERLLATLSGFFGVLALLLAMIGLYGVLSYLVTQRQVEFGIRMALGAQQNSILRLVMRDVLIVLAAGLTAGLAISLVGAKVLQKMLYGLEPRDPITIVMAVCLLSAMALLAGYLPARRATRVDPMVALRYE
ncbi:MAG TPA: ABC transporter permease [Candidatus Angelobacter sp.]